MTRPRPTALLVLAPKVVEWPLYSAVRLWMPAARVEIVQPAVLPVSATSLQMTVVPDLKSTVPTPLGLLGEDVTVAVNVTESPNVLGLVPPVRESVVVVAAGPAAAILSTTVWAVHSELVLKVASNVPVDVPVAVVANAAAVRSAVALALML